MRQEKIGCPDTFELAVGIYRCGVRSCAQLDNSGALLTKDPDVREALDFWLQLFTQFSDCQCMAFLGKDDTL